MKVHWILVAMLWLAGCTTLERAVHIHSSTAAAPSAFAFRDGLPGVLYQFKVNAEAGDPDTALFLIGGSGCARWKSVMPDYVRGFNRPAHVFALNKRHIEDRSLGILPCSTKFHEHNNLDQWVSDYLEIIHAKLSGLVPRPRHVVVVGVSEGALPGSMIAAKGDVVTHLALLGFGGWSIMRSLEDLYIGRPDEMDAKDIRQIYLRAPDSLSDEVYGHPYRWWTRVANVDPMPLLLRLDIPILVGMGERDINVSPAAARDLAKQFSTAGKTNLVVQVYPKADYRLDAPDKSYRADFFGELARLTHQPSGTANQSPASAADLK